MAGTVSVTIKNLQLQGSVGDNKVTGAPASWWAGFSTTVTTVDGSGNITTVTEPSGAGYARVEIANTDAEWTIVDNSATNANVVSFPEATDDYADPVECIILWDASTAGTPLYSAPASPSGAITILLGSIPRLDPGDIDMTVGA